METNSYQYDVKFEGNILVLGQTACGKTTFIQNLAKKTIWPDKVCNLAYKNYPFKKREDNIRSCFDVKVNFTYPQNLSEFDYLI